MRTIDVQVHAYERNHPGRPWAGQLHGPQTANGKEMVARWTRSALMQRS
jgi:L-fuconolactonase